MLSTELYTLLPDFIATPDGMTIDAEGRLILACPNFADESKPGCIARLTETPDGVQTEKWFDVAVCAETGQARPMGIDFDEDYNLYICDNQGWSGKEEYAMKGRILKVSFDDRGNPVKTTVVASGMEHPNGVKIRNGEIYVTQSCLSKVSHPSGKLMSCVYRFRCDDENIAVTNTMDDPNILAVFLTENPDCQYGADGIAFDAQGNLYVGNFGDGAVYRITFDEKGQPASNKIWAVNRQELTSTDGICLDDKGNFYVADFCFNGISRITPDGKISRLAANGDTDGFHGELDQPGEPIYYKGKLIMSCFDLVTDPGKVNTAHEMPATLCCLKL